MALLSVNDINVYYGSIHAIKGVSFEVNEGEIVTLIGFYFTETASIILPSAGLNLIETVSPLFMMTTVSASEAAIE